MRSRSAAWIWKALVTDDGQTHVAVNALAPQGLLRIQLDFGAEARKLRIVTRCLRLFQLDSMDPLGASLGIVQASSLTRWSQASEPIPLSFKGITQSRREEESPFPVSEYLNSKIALWQ